VHLKRIYGCQVHNIEGRGRRRSRSEGELFRGSPCALGTTRAGGHPELRKIPPPWYSGGRVPRIVALLRDHPIDTGREIFWAAACGGARAERRDGDREGKGDVAARACKIGMTCTPRERLVPRQCELAGRSPTPADGDRVGAESARVSPGGTGMSESTIQCCGDEVGGDEAVLGGEVR
jgi:hypothetical protein